MHAMELKDIQAVCRGFLARTRVAEELESAQSSFKPRQWGPTWQAEEDAARYADMLSAQDSPEGTAVEMDVAILLEFCRDAGHQLCLVPSDTVVIPPEANVEQFEWSPGAPHAPPPPPHTLLRYLRLLLAFTSTISSPTPPPSVLHHHLQASQRRPAWTRRR